ncbi:hypothetical protein M7I_2411 [Glarea lozoyensis 74030]|uniref:Uncharacterized protein n=1 Tax=Glarea lozoyensis (strain ATCC 74030 / MF5533) TaxID=1104152 RepID=H0EIP8_GLAL7|nr:hypothetical protein M7I_2411 [Glarea lozoyensis 74030]
MRFKPTLIKSLLLASLTAALPIPKTPNNLVTNGLHSIPEIQSTPVTNISRSPPNEIFSIDASNENQVATHIDASAKNEFAAHMEELNRRIAQRAEERIPYVIAIFSVFSGTCVVFGMWLDTLTPQNPQIGSSQ